MRRCGHSQRLYTSASHYPVLFHWLVSNSLSLSTDCLYLFTFCNYWQWPRPRNKAIKYCCSYNYSTYQMCFLCREVVETSVKQSNRDSLFNSTYGHLNLIPKISLSLVIMYHQVYSCTFIFNTPTLCQFGMFSCRFALQVDLNRNLTWQESRKTMI